MDVFYARSRISLNLELMIYKNGRNWFFGHLRPFLYTTMLF